MQEGAERVKGRKDGWYEGKKRRKEKKKRKKE